MKRNKLKLLIKILAIIVICLISFVGIYIQNLNTMKNVVKAGVFIKDMNDFAAINEVYNEYLGDVKPARACVEVARLPKDVKVEIEVIAVK